MDGFVCLFGGQRLAAICDDYQSVVFKFTEAVSSPLDELHLVNERRRKKAEATFSRRAAAILEFTEPAQKWIYCRHYV